VVQAPARTPNLRAPPPRLQREGAVAAGRTELAARAKAPGAVWPAPERGYARLFHKHVTQADEGCDFDFLVPAVGAGNQQTKR
jgi:hypothetical protein